jgi:hypothetical protein
LTPCFSSIYRTRTNLPPLPSERVHEWIFGFLRHVIWESCCTVVQSCASCCGRNNGAPINGAPFTSINFIFSHVSTARHAKRLNVMGSQNNSLLPHREAIHVALSLSNRRLKNHLQCGRGRLISKLRSRSICPEHIGGLKICVMEKNGSPRISARNSKLRALTPCQIKSLRQWLILDRLTYDQTRAKLRERFGVSLSTGTLSRFWNTYCQNIVPPRPSRRLPVLLDVTLQSTKPIRVIVRETKARLRFKVGTQRQLGLSKRPTFTVNPTGGDKSKP